MYICIDMHVGTAEAEGEKDFPPKKRGDKSKIIGSTLNQYQEVVKIVRRRAPEQVPSTLVLAALRPLTLSSPTTPVSEWTIAHAL